MEQDFYKGRLQHLFGLDVLIPDADDRATVHRIIYNELVQGRVEPASREAYRAVIGRLIEDGAEAVILGCTEIMLLVSQMTARFRCSTRPGFTPRPRWIARCRWCTRPRNPITPCRDAG